MKTLEVTENRLFYIGKQYANCKRSWNTSMTSFVRTGRYKDGKLVGSELYKCRKASALLFKSYDEARLFARRYEADCEILELRLADSNKDAILEITLEGELFGIKCYKLVDGYKYKFKRKDF